MAVGLQPTLHGHLRSCELHPTLLPEKIKNPRMHRQSKGVGQGVSHAYPKQPEYLTQSPPQGKQDKCQA